MPFQKLSDALQIPNEVWLKFENQHHYGSHKGRSFTVMIDEYFKNGTTSFVLSSSGNAALAAAKIVTTHNKNTSKTQIRLKIFLGNNIDSQKLKLLREIISSSTNISVEQVENPKQSALKYEKDTGAKWLRSSTDPLALVGYADLAKELSKIPNLAAVFVAASSGTAAQGIHEGFTELQINPQIHIIQTDYCHPLVSYFKGQPELKNDKPSIARAIVDKIGHRKEFISEVLKNSHGSGWTVSDSEINTAVELTKQTTGHEVTPNGALSVAGLKKAITENWKWEGPVVCIISGR